MTLFPLSYAHFMPEGLFDHCPCIIRFKEEIFRRTRPFKYFNMWKLDESFDSVIDGVWRLNLAGNMMFRVVTKLKLLKQELKKMDEANFSRIEKRDELMQLAWLKCQEALWKEPKNQNLV